MDPFFEGCLVDVEDLVVEQCLLDGLIAQHMLAVVLRMSEVPGIAAIRLT